MVEAGRDSSERGPGGRSVGAVGADLVTALAGFASVLVVLARFRVDLLIARLPPLASSSSIVPWEATFLVRVVDFAGTEVERLRVESEGPGVEKIRGSRFTLREDERKFIGEVRLGVE